MAYLLALVLSLKQAGMLLPLNLKICLTRLKLRRVFHTEYFNNDSRYILYLSQYPGTVGLIKALVFIDSGKLVITTGDLQRYGLIFEQKGHMIWLYITPAASGRPTIILSHFLYMWRISFL